MTDPKPMNEADLTAVNNLLVFGREMNVDAVEIALAERLLAEIRRLHARERELHNRIRLEFVQDGSKLDWWVCQECGKTGPSPERHAFVNGKPCLAAPLPKEDEG